MKTKLSIVSAKAYKTKDGYGEYRFPFEVLDKTAGGSNLGRIEWHLECLTGKKTKGRYYIEKLLIWATQTRDERYVKKIFEIPCYTEALCGDSLLRESYVNYVWRVMPCEIHKTMMFSAYPANNHKELVINVGSSIGIDIDFV